MIWCRYRDTHGPRFAIVEGDVAQPVDGTPFDGAGEAAGNALPFAELSCCLASSDSNLLASRYEPYRVHLGPRARCCAAGLRPVADARRRPSC